MSALNDYVEFKADAIAALDEIEDRYPEHRDRDDATVLALAQVRATLALAAATYGHTTAYRSK